MTYQDRLVEDTLASFCSAIEAVGGVVECEDGTTGLAVDPDWIDLASVYLRACAILERDPLVAET